MSDPCYHDRIVKRLEALGLASRGGFHPTADERIGTGRAHAVRTVLLVGNIGGSLWSAFRDGRRAEAHPLDGWSKRTLNTLADDLPGQVSAVFPSDGPPYVPFQQWAMRSEAVRPSPLGPLIHPAYGLWHAYRGALLFADRFDLPTWQARPSPCATCADRPCLKTCPAGAIDDREGGLDVVACAEHLLTPAGDTCLAAGCLARCACPVGADSRYGEPQARFHMAAFLRAHGPGQSS